MIVKKNLFIPSKIKYVKGDKPPVDCILCAIVEKNPRVENLEVFRSAGFCVSANLYPYSPGHLMIFPTKHVEDVRRLSQKEALELFKLEKASLDILDKVYTPHGYNIGYNIGEGSGNSIRHLHLHIVPRYRNELGFVDVMGDARIIVDNPRERLPKVRRLFREQKGAFGV